MSNKKPRTRVYINENLCALTTFLVDGNQGHYLVNVLRINEGEYVAVFNGRDGEWLGEITKVGKGKAKITIEKKVGIQQEEKDIWYLYAPVKKARVDYMMQKVTELGVSRICPVVTKRTNLDRIKPEKIIANVIEASEQSGRMTIPEIDVMTSLEERLENWPEDRLLIFCDEAGDAVAMDEIGADYKKSAILIGPEGGFTEEERQMIRAHKNSIAISLGPRVLRADTAAVAALSLWQTFHGDWQILGTDQYE